MSSIDASEALVDVLRAYFSTPIARALLTSTLRRAQLPHDVIEGRAIASAVGALEQVLPNYITDAARRAACIEALRRVVSSRSTPSEQVAPPRLEAPAPPAAAPAASTATIILVRTSEDVVNACEVGRDIARKVGFSNVDQVKVATATAELTRNVLLYATVGEMRLSSLEAPRPGVEIAVSDKGPGIPDLALVMSDRYRSRTGMGMGLKGAKRLMDTFEIESSPEGTKVLARKFVR